MHCNGSSRLTSQLSKLISSAEEYGALRLVNFLLFVASLFLAGWDEMFIFGRCEEQLSIQLETLSKGILPKKRRENNFCNFCHCQRSQHCQHWHRVSQKKWCIALSNSRVVLDVQRLIKLTDT